MAEKTLMNEQTKEAYRRKAEAEMKEIKARLALLRAQGENKRADVQVEYQKRLNELNDRYERIAHQMDDLGHAAQEAWDDLVSGIDRAISELRIAVETAFDRFGR